MKKLIGLFSVCLLLFGMVGVAGAVSINYFHNNPVTDPNQFISPYAGVTTENFEVGLIWTWTGSFHVLNVDIGDVASAPFGESTKDASYYVSVPKNVNNTAQSVKVTNLRGSYNYFGIWWGSVDDYNKLDFYSGNNPNPVASFTGSGAINPSTANGDQTAPSTNLYVNFLDLPWFDSFMMTSTSYAFEADNIAVGVVPEPATMLLLGSGLIGLAGFARKRFKK